MLKLVVIFLVSFSCISTKPQFYGNPYGGQGMYMGGQYSPGIPPPMSSQYYQQPPPPQSAYQPPMMGPPMAESMENFDETEIKQTRRFGTRRRIGSPHSKVIVHHVYEPMGFMGGPGMFGGGSPNGGLVGGVFQMLFGTRKK
ncbi:unnamed protein product, partial [Mesorhabditis belari]|uniref:Uncharacterized protein n=1 Tax=Mesorhabditis belari TaxID=2138241 RepID=A0AAF3EFV2_9BILA